jgi:hypothetical protein
LRNEIGNAPLIKKKLELKPGPIFEIKKNQNQTRIDPFKNVRNQKKERNP